MNKFLEKWLVKKIVKNDLMKQILNSSFMESIDKSLDPSWKTVMQILWVLAIIFGVLGFFTLLGVWGIGALLGGVFSITFLLFILLWLIWSLLAVIWWRGMFKMKKWLPCIYTLSVFVTILSILVSAAGRGGSINYLSLIITLFFWFIVLRKRKTFVN